MKLWVLSDTKTGYIYRFKFFIGKDGDDVNHGLSYSVVNKRLENRKNKGNFLYVDNFYTSPTLFRDVEYASGSVCSDC